MWEKVEKSYESCSELLSVSDDGADTSTVLEAKYSYCYSVYSRCVAQLQEIIERGAAQSTLASSSGHTPPSTGCRLPPVDTEVFAGDYLRWPTFRDLFTAVYIHNSRLTPVEKLFHLLSKTTGEAHAIVAKAPLTNEGFVAAWQSLTDRFENRRLLVNSQLKILFNIQAVPQESGVALKDLQGTIQSCLTALEMSSIQVVAWDSLLVYMVSSKLSEVTLSLWEQSIHNKDRIPTWKELDAFLTERHRTLESIDDVSPTNSRHFPPELSTPRAPAPRLHSSDFRVTPTPRPRRCDLCSMENHPLRRCPRFLKMTVVERSNIIRRKQLCLNCLARGHQQRDCPSAHSCLTCRKRHHTLLHPRNSLASSHSSSHSSSQPNHRSSNPPPSPTDIMPVDPTAIIYVRNKAGESMPCRAILDSASQISFITSRLANQLNLNCRKSHTLVAGIGESSLNSDTAVDILAQSRDASYRASFSAVVTDSITEYQPHFDINAVSWKIPENISLADPHFNRSDRIDLIIGAGLFFKIMATGQIHLGSA
ncbi:hypothetical protein KR200_000575, partial [Drosophila serrata]